MKAFFIIAAFISVFRAAEGFGTTHYVKSNGSGDVPTIQAGIDAAGDGDTVLVAPGYYTGEGNRDIDFRGKAIVVMSEAGASSTIIDCAKDSDGQWYRGFYFHSGEDTCSVLKGFTIYRGLNDYSGGGICCLSSSPLITDNILVNNHAYKGGGIYCFESACVIRNNVIEHSNLIWENRFEAGQPRTIDMEKLKKYNEAMNGGGIYCSHSAPKIIGNVIRYNYASFIGGGIYSSSSSAEIRDNDIFDNYAEAGDAGGIYCYNDGAIITRNKIIDNGSEGSGGIHSQYSRLIIEYNDITENLGCYGGGGIMSINDVSITIRHNSICYNRSVVSGAGVDIWNSPTGIEHNTIEYNSGGYGGLKLVGDSSVVAADNVICKNRSDYGGGIYCGGSPRIERNIIIGNYADYYGGGIYCRNSKSIIRYNIICENSSMDNGCGIDCSISSPLIAHNTIADNYCYFSGASIYCWNNSNPDIRNCIVTGSYSSYMKIAVAGIAAASESSIPGVSCCDVFGNEGGNYEGFPDQTGSNGNISADPIFCNPDNDDYSLSAISPCLPGNHPNGYACGLMGAVGRGCGGLVSTLVRDFDLSVENGVVRLRWTLTAFEDPANLSIHRSSGRSPFEEIPDPAIAVDDLSYSYVDNVPEPEAACRYRVYLDENGKGRMLYETDPLEIPRLPFTLFQNYPNPFNPSTMIRYYIPEKSQVRLHIYSITGTLIDCVVNELQERGLRTAEWDGTDREGRPVAAGIYVYTLQTRKNTAAKKMVLIR